MSLCITTEFSTRILTSNLRISQKITTLKKQDGGTCQNLLIVHDTAEAHLINHFTATDCDRGPMINYHMNSILRGEIHLSESERDFEQFQLEPEMQPFEH